MRLGYKDWDVHPTGISGLAFVHICPEEGAICQEMQGVLKSAAAESEGLGQTAFKKLNFADRQPREQART